MTGKQQVSRQRRRRRNPRGSSTRDITTQTTNWNLRQGPVHKFVRLFNSGELSIAATDQGYATIFALSFIPNSSDFTNLFDQFRIDKVEFTFEMDIADGVLNSTTKWPRVVVAPDFNNQSAPLSENDILQYEQSKQYQFSTSDRRFSVTLRPMVAATMFRTGVTSAYAMQPSGWLDIATSDVPHYGLRYWVNNHNTTSFGSSRIRTYTRYWLSFKNAS